MEARRCDICSGSGQVMGGGMIFHDCKKCDGEGKLNKPVDEISYLTVKSSESYQRAVEEIKESANVSKEKAEELFEKQLNKQINKRRERIK